MIRVHVICEGQTEEAFVNDLLSEQFVRHGIQLVPALIGIPGHKGGNVKIDRLFTDIRARLLGDTSSFCTTFFDFYGLPEDFPGKKASGQKTDIVKKAVCIHTALVDWLREKIGDEPLRRFIPYVQMYEFEGLLFSDPIKLASGIHRPGLAPELVSIRKQFPTPEDINNDYSTSPGRRIKKLFPDYQKPTDGVLAVLEIGIGEIRRECALFNQWLCCLEALHSSSTESKLCLK